MVGSLVGLRLGACVGTRVGRIEGELCWDKGVTQDRGER